MSWLFLRILQRKPHVCLTAEFGAVLQALVLTATLVRVSQQSHGPESGFTLIKGNPPLSLCQHFIAALKDRSTVIDALQNSQDNEQAIPDKTLQLHAGRTA